MGQKGGGKEIKGANLSLDSTERASEETWFGDAIPCEEVRRRLGFDELERRIGEETCDLFHGLLTLQSSTNFVMNTSGSVNSFGGA